MFGSHSSVLTISLEKSIYFPGELVKGTVRVNTNKAIKCRAIRVELQGKGGSQIVRGSGDDRKVYYHKKVYAHSRKVIWGKFFTTPKLNGCGTNAIYGPPWAPDEGVMYLPYDGSNNILIIRVMDYDWGKKDDLLGEICVDISQCINRGGMEFPLTRNGKPERGTVSFTLTSETNPLHYYQGANTIRLQIISATNLRSADMIGKNDVYVQAYYSHSEPTSSGGLMGMLSSAVGGNKGLPEPIGLVEYPASDQTIPFEFQLPSNLPSSFSWSNNYVTYSIYANIDVAWKMDPSSRCFFTVIQPHVVASMMSPQRTIRTHDIYPRCCVPIFCCCSVPLSCFASRPCKIDATVDRSCYAPGEKILVRISVESDAGNRITSSCAYLQQSQTSWAQGHVDNWTRDVSQRVSFSCESNQTQIEIPVPPLPPTYPGGLGKDPEWSRKLAQYGIAEAWDTPDPVVWKYSLEIDISIQDTGLSILSTEYSLTLPIVIGAIGLSYLPPYQDTAYWEAQERMQAPAPTSAMAPIGGDVRRVNPVNSPVDYQQQQQQQALIPSPQPTLPEGVVVYNWQNVPNLTAILPTVGQNAQSAPSYTGGTLIYDEEEDYTADKNKLNYTPTYYVGQN